MGLQEHSRYGRIDRELSEAAAKAGQSVIVDVGAFVVRADGTEFSEQAKATDDGAFCWGVDEWKGADVAEFESHHPEDDRGEIRTMDLGSGVAVASEKLLFVVETVANDLAHAATAALALVRARLGDWFDGQTLSAGVGAVATDSGEAGIDDIADTRDGERGFRDVGREDDAPSTTGMEDALLIGIGEAAE